MNYVIDIVPGPQFRFDPERETARSLCSDFCRRGCSPIAAGLRKPLASRPVGDIAQRELRPPNAI